MFGKMRPNQYFHYGHQGQMMHQGQIGQQWDPQFYWRNQPATYQSAPLNYEWNPYQQQGPYMQHVYQPYGQNYHPGVVPQNMPYPNQSYSQNESQFLFHNPLQPQDEMYPPQSVMQMNGYQMMNPYPKQNVLPKQPGGMQSLMNSFKSQDGSVDFNKMINTAGQMMNTLTQVSSLVKGFGGIFKS